MITIIIFSSKRPRYLFEVIDNIKIFNSLLKELHFCANKEKVISIAELMGNCGWVWAPIVSEVLGANPQTSSTLKANSLNIGRIYPNGPSMHPNLQPQVYQLLKMSLLTV